MEKINATELKDCRAWERKICTMAKRGMMFFQAHYHFQEGDSMRETRQAKLRLSWWRIGLDMSRKGLRTLGVLVRSRSLQQFRHTSISFGRCTTQVALTVDSRLAWRSSLPQFLLLKAGCSRVLTQRYFPVQKTARRERFCSVSIGSSKPKCSVIGPFSRSR